MVEGVTESGHTRKQRKEENNSSISQSTCVWSPRNQLNLLSDIEILLVARNKTRHTQICQGLRPMSTKQSKHTHHQSTSEPNNTRGGGTTLPNNCHGLHCQTTPIRGIQFDLDGYRPQLHKNDDCDPLQ